MDEQAQATIDAIMRDDLCGLIHTGEQRAERLGVPREGVSLRQRTAVAGPPSRSFG
jgi:hypothetical protein